MFAGGTKIAQLEKYVTCTPTKLYMKSMASLLDICLPNFNLGLNSTFCYPLATALEGI